MRRFLTALSALSVCVVLSAPQVAAQAPASETVQQLAVVRELFDAMRAGDSARVRAVFHPQMAALMSSDTGRDGVARVQFTPVDAFVKAMGTPHAAVYDERIYNPRVLIDGTLASVWTDYSFFLGTTLSHCGVDVFHVAKVGEAWKIIALTDTRRTTGCNK